MDLFQSGDFRLHGGASSFFKIECDALGDADVAALARMIARLVAPFGCVTGVPRGGLRLASALVPYADTGFDTCLIVDDVLTSGGSMEEARVEISRGLSGGFGSRHFPEVLGAVVFARGPCPSWVRPLFQLPEALWVER